MESPVRRSASLVTLSMSIDSLRCFLKVAQLPSHGAGSVLTAVGSAKSVGSVQKTAPGPSVMEKNAVVDFDEMKKGMCPQKAERQGARSHPDRAGYLLGHGWHPWLQEATPKGAGWQLDREALKQRWSRGHNKAWTALKPGGASLTGSQSGQASLLSALTEPPLSSFHTM